LVNEPSEMKISVKSSPSRWSLEDDSDQGANGSTCSSGKRQMALEPL